MMKTIKRWVAAGAALMCAGLTAWAQNAFTASAVGNLTGGTNYVQTNSATVYASALLVHAQYAAVQLSLATTGPSSNTVATVWRTSLDNSNWTDLATWTISAQGTNPISLRTNLPLVTGGYLQFYALTNNCTNQITNVCLVVGYTRGL